MFWKSASYWQERHLRALDRRADVAMEMLQIAMERIDILVDRVDELQGVQTPPRMYIDEDGRLRRVGS